MRTRLIAEIGLTHEGSLGLAISMAKVAIQSGADIVKFQAHFPEYESSRFEKFRVAFSVQDKSRWDYWQRTSFTVLQWELLKNFVEKHGARFSTSVFSSHAFDLMKNIGVEVIKIGSADLNNEELLENLQDFRGTLIFSTGMARWDEIRKVADWLKMSNSSPESAILQCTSSYPTALNKVGINVMNQISEEFDVYSGLSDHSRGINSSISAIVKGAHYIEKHVVLSPFMFGPDVTSSITMEEFAKLREFRDDYLSISTPVDKDLVAEELSELRILFGRSLALKEDKQAGEKVSLEDFCLRKPFGGFSWEEKTGLVGRVLSKPYRTSEILNESHFNFMNNRVNECGE